MDGWFTFQKNTEQMFERDEEKTGTRKSRKRNRKMKELVSNEKRAGWKRKGVGPNRPEETKKRSKKRKKKRKVRRRVYD